MNEWISVEDEMPDENVEVLGIDQTGEYWLMTQQNGTFTDWTDEPVSAVYWQPLPEPPQ